MPWTLEGFFTFLLREDALFIVAEERGEVLGYCGVLTVLGEGEITNVAVRRSRQREGIGKFLLEGLFLLLKDWDVSVLHLEVRKSNEAAIRLYRRLGVKGDGLRKGYYSAPVEDAVLMTREEMDSCVFH